MQRFCRALLLCTVPAGMAEADSPAIPQWSAPKPAQCSDFTHPDQVVSAIAATTSCKQGMAIYYRCEARWDNNPEMEDAAKTACHNDTAKLRPRLQEQYENAEQACEERYQDRNMRIQWSAVRNCKVRLAERWAKRYPRRN